MQHHGGLDALRGFLALVVFAGHSADVFLKPTGQTALTDAANQAAHAAVTCFFVLSGYVIAMSLDENRRRGFSFAEYAVSRVARIAPPLLVVILLTWIAAAALGQPERFATDPSAQLLALLSWGTAGELRGGLNGPLWSLAYEMQLYAMAGLVAVGAFTRHKVLALLLLAGYLWLIGGLGADSRTVIYLTFGAGCAAYALRGLPWRRIGALALGLALATVTLHTFAAGVEDDTRRLYVLLAADLTVAGLCALLIQTIARTGSLRGLAMLGASSYTLYILHFPALLFADCIGIGAVGVPLALAFCWTVGYVVERPRQQRQAIMKLLAA